MSALRVSDISRQELEANKRFIQDLANKSASFIFSEPYDELDFSGRLGDEARYLIHVRGYAFSDGKTALVDPEKFSDAR
jgi:hypothetical protein